MSDAPDISARKADHIDLCTDGDVGFARKTTLLEEVELIHDALPELAMAEVDTRVEFAGKTLAAPILIAAMTGGVDRAEEINRTLASVAEELGLGFGFGSMRPLLTRGIQAGYKVREQAPNALLLGNIGVVQAAQTPTAALSDLVAETGVDALCVHLNPAMEVVQPEGDDDFRGGLDTIARLVDGLEVPVVVKETGCGLSRRVGHRLVSIGVEWVDVSGAGGTSWVAVEMLRAQGGQRALGEAFRDWGIPTAASVAQLSGLGLGIAATGGLSTGLELARALALGARVGGVARPLLQALARGGREAVVAHLQGMIAELRVACLLCGARTPEDLAQMPLLVGPRLQRWVPADSPLHRRLLG